VVRLSGKEREQKKQDEIKRRRAELDHASVVSHVDDGPPIGCGDSGCFHCASQRHVHERRVSMRRTRIAESGPVVSL